MFRPGQPPDVGNAPVQVRQAIDASQQWFDDQGQNAALAAEAIVSRRAGEIHQFYQAQQANRSISGLAISRTHLNLGDVRLTYETNNGQAILTVVVFPENTKPQPNAAGDIDLNFDGYFVWVHCEPDYPDLVGTGSTTYPNVPGPYDVYLNGYLVMENIVIEQTSAALMVMFGSTAARVPSLVDPPDAESEQNPLAAQDNGGLVPGPIPQLAKVPPNTGPDYASLPEHNDLFGYWMFDWTNVLNQGSYMPDLSKRWDTLGYKVPQVVQGIQFADPQKSPLVSSGVNDFSVSLSPLPNVISEFEVVIRNVIYSEFYDRGKTTTVTTSWTKQNAQGIIVNDTPLHWCSSTPGGGGDPRQSGIGIKVDLTPGLKPSDRDDDLVMVNDPPTGGQGAQFGLSDAQVAANNAYQAEIVAFTEAYLASIAPELAAAVAAFNATLPPLEAAQVAFQNAVNEVSARQSTVNAYLEIIATADPSSGSYQAAVASLPEAELLLSQAEQALTSATDAYRTAQDVSSKAAAVYANLQVPPNLPARPPSAGKKLDAFVYRLFTVSGDQWDFGPWQNT